MLKQLFQKIDFTNRIHAMVIEKIDEEKYHIDLPKVGMFTVYKSNEVWNKERPWHLVTTGMLFKDINAALEALQKIYLNWDKPTQEYNSNYNLDNATCHN